MDLQEHTTRKPWQAPVDANGQPLCTCGCGASIKNWSLAAMTLPRAAPRYRHSHGQCYYCGQPLDQYRACGQCC